MFNFGINVFALGLAMLGLFLNIQSSVAWNGGGQLPVSLYWVALASSLGSSIPLLAGLAYGVVFAVLRPDISSPKYQP